MDTNYLRPLPFRQIWIGWGIPVIRECNATYCETPLASLPPIDIVDDLSWLTRIDPRLHAKLREPGKSDPWSPESAAKWSPGWRRRFEPILADAERKGVRLPRSYTELMSSTDLHNHILDPTGCFFELPDGLSPAPFGLEGHILRFQNDSQGCVFWYLYLPPRGVPVVLASSEMLETLPESDPQTLAQAAEDTFLVAYSFAEFLYRFWIEGLLWYKISYEVPLNAAEAAYIGPQSVRAIAARGIAIE